MVGANAVTRRCIFGEDSSNFVLEYGRQFWNEYKDENKFLMLEFMDAHEGSGEVVKYLDAPLTEFLQNSIDWSNTTLILMSDHGWHMHSIFYLLELEIVQIEAMLPTLFILMPEDYLRGGKNNNDNFNNNNKNQ